MNEFRVVVHYIASDWMGAKLADFRLYYITAPNESRAVNKARRRFSRQVQEWKKNDPNLKDVTSVRFNCQMEAVQLSLLSGVETDTPCANRGVCK